eukprot:s2456_g7.t1
MIVKGGGVQRLMLHPALRGDESPVFDEEDFNAVLDKVVAAVPTPSLLLDDEVLGRPLQELICGDGDKLDSMIVDTLDGNETFGFECELLTKSGNISILEMNATARYDASGDAVGVIIMAKEASWNFLESLCLCGGIVSHTKRQDRSDPDEFSSKPQVEMWQAEQRMFFETSLRPIFTIDGDGKIQDWNRKAGNIGWIEEDMEEMSCALRRVYGGEEEVKTELALRDLKGNEHEVEIRVRPRCAADGSVQGALVIGCHNMDLLLAQHQRYACEQHFLLLVPESWMENFNSQIAKIAEARRETAGKFIICQMLLRFVQLLVMTQLSPLAFSVLTPVVKALMIVVLTAYYGDEMSLLKALGCVLHTKQMYEHLAQIAVTLEESAQQEIDVNDLLERGEGILQRVGKTLAVSASMYHHPPSMPPGPVPGSAMPPYGPPEAYLVLRSPSALLSADAVSTPPLDDALTR